MKKISLILLVMLYLTFRVNAKITDGEQPVKSKIQKVTVFLNKAQLTSIANVNIGKGNTTLIFEGLSSKIDANSIQVSADGKLTIMSVKPRVNFMKEHQQSPRLEMLQDSLTYYNHRIDLVKIQQDILKKEEEMILANNKIGGNGVEVNAAKLQAMAEFYRKRLTEIQTKLLVHHREMQKLQEAKNRINIQISTENSQLNRPTSEIMVVVSAESFTSAKFEITYIVADAGWRPIYDLRAKNTNSGVELTYKAEVFQNTGSDWNNVKVALSTGNPSQDGTKPVLNPWYVDFYNPYVSIQSRTAGAVIADRAEREKKKDKAEEQMLDEPASTIADFTEVNEMTLATEFDIDIPYSIPSNGKPQMLTVQVHNLATEYAYSAVPKLDLDAFLMSKISGWETYNLLSGKANVYFEGRFVGETYLDANNTKDTLAISLGRDKKIVIEREKIKDFSTKRFIGTNVKEDFGFEIKVRNTKKEAVTITIEEQIPISQSNQIDVKLLESEGAEYDEASGKITLKLSLKPSESKTLTLKYSLKYPKNKQIAY